MRILGSHGFAELVSKEIKSIQKRVGKAPTISDSDPSREQQSAANSGARAPRRPPVQVTDHSDADFEASQKRIEQLKAQLD